MMKPSETTVFERIAAIWEGLGWQDAREAAKRCEAIEEECEMEYEGTGDADWLQAKAAAIAAYNHGCPVWAMGCTPIPATD